MFAKDLNKNIEFNISVTIMITGHLKILTLKFLNKEPLSGYSLMKKIKDATGKMPSPGSIYPMLEILLEERLVEFKQDRRKKIYYLTKKGKLKIRQLKKKKEEIINNITELMQILGNVCEKNEHYFFKNALNHIKMGSFPLMHLQPELSELKAAIIKKGGKKNKNSEKIRQILKKAASEIKKIK